MVRINGQNPKGVDFSIMPSLECNLKCGFCMYDCSPDQCQQIQLDLLKDFLETIPDNLINSYGLYGGEPSINLSLYEKVIELLPLEKPKFIITNGAWSKDIELTKLFIEFVEKYSLMCFVSFTSQHKAYQNSFFLRRLAERKWNFEIKKDDTQRGLLPMGRNSQRNWTCTGKCNWSGFPTPTRLAVMPDGNIIFQTCDGVYPIVGNMKDPFDFKRYLEGAKWCWYYVSRKSRNE